ncbi:hypothetical protein O0I10_011010 [Lichtheimia ornata]|uniref:Uncharacterized protein n=1 Tax=Lichtheimia ornata TaxID=688661 RepID=A0AAD7XQV0_9FUNG|nr:uncharacterized protein O0I10_011010 [Lichtheimia ornata]KAJ8653359.1 hypothetical protein O0I10_011010 [Lichtheimia ornata]
MGLRGPKLYVMARLSKLNLIRASDDLGMLPILVSRIAQIQAYALETAAKVQQVCEWTRNNHSLKPSHLPSSYNNGSTRPHIR